VRLRASCDAESAAPVFDVGSGCVWIERLKIVSDMTVRDSTFVCEFSKKTSKENRINVDNVVQEDVQRALMSMRV
jgi:hypothetical protein